MIWKHKKKEITSASFKIRDDIASNIIKSANKSAEWLIIVSFIHHKYIQAVFVKYFSIALDTPSTNLSTSTVLSIGAGGRPKKPATGQSLAGYFCLTYY